MGKRPLWLRVVAILAATGLFAATVILRHVNKPRIAFKEAALKRLAAIQLTNDTIRAQLHELKAAAAGSRMEMGCANTNTLLMANGEFIVFEYRHGRNDIFPPHLFLGRASNGQWLYSSYHFCNEMNMVRHDDQPASIADFSAKYFARIFDGRSDACLRRTQ